MAYETTSVPVERSQSEIRKLLSKFGATAFHFGEGHDVDGTRWAALSFEHQLHTVLMRVTLKTPDRYDMNTPLKAENAWAKEERRIWRVLFWALKARMIAIDEKLETFEQAFLAHIVDPRSGMTIWQYVQPAIDRGDLQIGGGGLKAITAGV